MTKPKLEKQTLKWLKEGRGSGHGADYKPWLTVRDVSSKGRVHRVLGHLTQRTHHLLSDLEFSTFLLLEWNRQVSDIREQFPLKIDETIEIADELGIRHPASAGNLHVMSSDFLVDLKRPLSSEVSKLALQIKPVESLFDPRTLEKMEIERIYWQRKGIEWKVVTERELPSVYIKNLAFLHSAANLTEPLDNLLANVPIIQGYSLNNQTIKLPDMAMLIDQSYGLEPGATLARIRALCALRIFTFDLHKPWQTLSAGDLNLIEADLSLDQLRYSYADN